MVKRDPGFRSWILPLGALLFSFMHCGCASVSKSRLDDCKLRLTAVQSENEQLRDAALNIRNQNRDMALRAVEDSRRLRAQDEAIQRLEKSVLAYQEERERMAVTLDQLRTQVKTAASEAPVTASLPDGPPGVRPDSAVQLTNFEPEQLNPQLKLEEESGRIKVSMDRLFKAGSDQFSPGGEQIFADICRVGTGWLAQESGDLVIQLGTLPGVAGRPSIPEDQRAWESWLSRARLARIRAGLVERTGLAESAVTTLASDLEKSAVGRSGGAAAADSILVIDRVVKPVP